MFNYQYTYISYLKIMSESKNVSSFFLFRLWYVQLWFETFFWYRCLFQKCNLKNSMLFEIFKFFASLFILQQKYKKYNFLVIKNEIIYYSNYLGDEWNKSDQFSIISDCLGYQSNIFCDLSDEFDCLALQLNFFLNVMSEYFPIEFILISILWLAK